MINMFKTSIALALLTGCGVPLLTLNELTTPRNLQHPPNAYGESIITIRSFKPGDDGTLVEFSGAVCHGKSKLISFSKVETPAQIELQTYLQAERFERRGQPPALTVTCQYNDKTVTRELTALSNVSNDVDQQGGTYDASTGTYSNPTVTYLTGRLSSTLPWRYNSIRVDFE